MLGNTGSYIGVHTGPAEKKILANRDYFMHDLIYLITKIRRRKEVNEVMKSGNHPCRPQQWCLCFIADKSSMPLRGRSAVFILFC